MAVGGAPEYTPKHAENVADVALCLLRHVKQLKLPSGINIQIRIGEFLRLGYPLDQRFSNFFQVGTTFISQNVLQTTLLLGLSNSLGLP